MARVDDVAAAIVERLGSVTAMQLEKLVYYCQCWHLARQRNPLFDEQIEAWRQGPVVPALYAQHRRRYKIDTWPRGRGSALEADEMASVEWVIGKYGHFSPVELSRMTHNELPWLAARGTLPESVASSNPIETSIIRLYYSRQIAEPETAITLATASAALEGIEFDDEWQERLRDVAYGSVTADQLVAEEIARLDQSR